MKLQELTLKNINSFGNKVQTIPFSDKSQLILLYGDNGVGKTTVTDALSLALYGNVAKRKLSKIPNRFNKGLEVSAKFITSENKNVHVFRGLAPRKFNLEIDGVPENTSIDDINDRLENELIKIPYNVFSNSVLLRLSEFESFVNMKVDKKRKIVDKIFESDIINYMFEEFKTQRKTVNDEADILVKERDNLETKIETLEQTFRNLKETINIDDFDLYAKTSQSAKFAADLDEINTKMFVDKTKWERKLIVFNNEILDAENQIRNIHSAHTTAITNLNNKYANNYTEYNNNIYNKIKLEYDNEITEINSILSTIDTNLAKFIAELEIEKTNLLESYKIIYFKKYNELKDSEEKLLHSELETLNSEFLKLNEELDAVILLINQANDANIIFGKQLATYNANKINLGNKVTLFEQGICPECESDLTDHKGHSKLSDYKNQITIINTSELSINQSMLTNSNIMINQTSKKIELNNKITEIQNKIFANQSKTNNIDNSIKLSLSEFNISEIKKIDDLINTKLNEYKNKNSELIKTKNKRLQEINEDIRNRVELMLMEFKIQNDKNHQIELTNLTDETNKSLTKYNELKNVLSSKKETEQTLFISIRDKDMEEKSKKQRQLDLVNSELIDYNSSKKLLDDSENQIKLHQAQIKEYETKLIEYTETQATNDIITQLLGEEGIKRHIIKRTLPAFNNSIDYFRNYLEYPYYFRFDENFDASISQYSYEIDPSEPSMGETRLMDLIIILSVFDLIIKKKHNLNIIFLDEIFTSLSKRNISKVTHLLKEYSQKYNINIIIVSHTEVPMEYFDKVYELYKDGDFSDMKELK